MQADLKSDRLPAVVDPLQQRADRQADLADLERMVTLAEKLAAANGKPIPPGITRDTYALMREHLRAIKASRTSPGV